MKIKPTQNKPKPRLVKTVIPLLNNEKVAVYAGKKVADALLEISKDMTIYHGVRLAEVLDALYDQGKKDGARYVFQQVDGLKDVIRHRNPGQPKKKKKQAAKK